MTTPTTPPPPRPIEVLIVEDDDAIATGLSLNLGIEGYQSVVVTDGPSAVARIERDPPDLVLLDISLPKLSGLEVLRRVRATGSQVPIIILSARGEEFDKVSALRLGADDYVTKPFALAELLARVVAVLRRAQRDAPLAPADSPSDGALRRFGDVEIDVDTRTVRRGGRAVKLTHLEFELLLFFARNPSKVFSREELLRHVWGLRHSGSRRTVDNFVAQLRAKLEANPERPAHFVTVRGSGYRFDP
ncbi:MAG: DNA-binding response regulator [Deltaproteobacteria bacterium]|nr:MAG: DNA-binding response regulator [Deltaproteobacteria bacterium]